MARYTGRTQPGGAQSSGGQSDGGLFSTVTSQLMSRKQQLRTPPPRPVFHGTVKGEKEFIAKAMGKTFAPEKFYKNMRAISEAIKSGHSTFIDNEGNEHHVDHVSPSQKLMAVKWANRGEVKTSEGFRKVAQGFIETAREEGQKLDTKKQYNIGTAHDVAARMEKNLMAKPVDKRAEHLKALAAMHSQIMGAGQPQATAAAIKQSTPPPPMIFAAITPLGIGSGADHSQTLRYSSAKPSAYSSVSGGIGQHSRSLAEPASTAPTGAVNEDNASLPQASEPNNTSVPSEPAMQFQEPEPLNQAQPSRPTIPSETPHISDPFGGSGDEE